MKRPVSHAAALAALCALASPPVRAADVSIGFSQGPGGYYSQTDRSGPYAVDSNGNASLVGAPATGSPTDAAVTQQSLIGLSVLGSRAAEPASRGEWSVQSQCASVMYIAFYAGTSAVSDPAAARLGTFAIDPAAAVGRQGGDQSFAQVFGRFKGPITLWGTSPCQAALTRQ